MLSIETARILVISKNKEEEHAIKTFLSRMPFNLSERDFAVGKLMPTDDFDFAIFNAMSLPRVQPNTELNAEDEEYIQLFRQYLNKPIRYVVYYGEFLYDLDKERCPSANSKFTLFARIKELIDFINHYKINSN